MNLWIFCFWRRLPYHILLSIFSYCRIYEYIHMAGWLDLFICVFVQLLQRKGWWERDCSHAVLLNGLNVGLKISDSVLRCVTPFASTFNTGYQDQLSWCGVILIAWHFPWWYSLLRIRPLCHIHVRHNWF